MAQALGAAELERLPDGWQPERLAGMDRDVEVLATDVIEGVEMTGRPIAGLRPGDVEADDARVAPADGTLGDFDGPGGLAHGGDEQLHRDRVTVRGGHGRAHAEPVQHRLDGLVEGQARAVHSSGAIRTSA